MKHDADYYAGIVRDILLGVGFFILTVAALELANKVP